MVKKVIKKVFMRKKEKEKERDRERERETVDKCIIIRADKDTSARREEYENYPGRLSLERPELGTTRKKSKKGRSSTKGTQVSLSYLVRSTPSFIHPGHFNKLQLGDWKSLKGERGRSRPGAFQTKV